MNNQFNLIGRLIKEPTLRNTSTGKNVCDIPLAVQNGKDDTTYITVNVWNKIAETVAKYCKKGDLIGINGIIRNHNWEDKNGNKHYDYTFIGNKLSFLATGTKKEEKTTDVYEEFGNEVNIDDFLD